MPLWVELQRCPDFSFDHVPNLIDYCHERRLTLDFERTWSGNWNRDFRTHGPRSSAKYNNRVRKKHRFVDLMRDEENCLAARLPDRQQLGLHNFAGLGI